MKYFNHNCLNSAYFFCFFILLTSCFQDQDRPYSTRPDPYAKISPGRYNAAFLIMNGVYNTELTAPYDVLQHTIFREGIRSINTFTVSNSPDPVVTFEGLQILPDFNYVSDSLPRIDILVVPSAEHHLDTDLEDKSMIEFVRMASDQAVLVTSHCDGSFVLAKAGVLDTVASTTFPEDIELYRQMFPHLDVRDNVLFVHDGKFITSAGGAKSFEASLYLIEMMYGNQIAESIAKGLVIDWHLADLEYLKTDRAHRYISDRFNHH